MKITSSLLCVACLVMLTQSAPAPFVVPMVTGAITVAIPAVTIPGVGVTVTAASVATALAAKGDFLFIYMYKITRINLNDLNF